MKLSETNARLRREMEERARLEEELRFSQKMDAVGRLAGAIAHDFNNLLSTIGVYAGLLEEAMPADSPLREDVEQIEGETPLDRQLMLEALGTPGSESFMESPQDAADVITRMCRRDPDARYRTLDELLEDLAILA